MNQTESGHGRLDNRQYSYAPISPVEAGLAYARSAYRCTRTWIDKKTLTEAEEQSAAKGEENVEIELRSHTRHFIGSLAPGDDKHKLDLAAQAIREHWSVENKNHYKRDTCQWREDDHRHRRVNAAQNLALTRNALLAIIPFGEGKTLSTCLNENQAHPARALKLIQQARPI